MLPGYSAEKKVDTNISLADTVIVGRDRQRKKSRIFTQYAQAEAYLRRHGFNRATY